MSLCLCFATLFDVTAFQSRFYVTALHRNFDVTALQSHFDVTALHRFDVTALSVVLMSLFARLF